jgi:hypothetical protein
MKKITSKVLSEYRFQVSRLTREINQLACKSAHDDPLIKGTPGEVYRRCGYKTCKCATDLKKRHGPYKVIQVYANGVQRQITLRKDQTDIWEKAQHYQQQRDYLMRLKKTCEKLAQLSENLIEQRIERWPT